MWKLMAGNYNPTRQKMEGKKSIMQGKREQLIITLTQDMGKIHLTSTSNFLLKYGTGHSFT
jgi:hypothetical protein